MNKISREKCKYLHHVGGRLQSNVLPPSTMALKTVGPPIEQIQHHDNPNQGRAFQLRHFTLLSVNPSDHVNKH